MASQAHRSFQGNKTDVNRLLEIHEHLGGRGRGRRKGVQCLNKAAIVLTSAVWEAYVEDVCADAIDHLSDHLTDSSNLPDLIKLEIAADIHSRYNDTPNKQKDRKAAWDLADEGWKAVLANNLTRIKGKLLTGNAFNSCKSENVKDLLERGIGLSNVCQFWRWQGATPEQVRTRLDEYIKLRGEIAHRGDAAQSIRKNECTAFLSLVERLVQATDTAVSDHLRRLTGSGF